MIYIKPSFYTDFRCIADKCKHNCCIGWEIDVDETAFEKYNKLTDDLGVEIRNKITTSPDGSKCFRLGEDERCPFLDKNNLCRIILNYSEDALCDICKNHPRFYEWFPGVTECGLGLCCEEVCRLLLTGNEPFHLIETNDFEPISLETKEDTAISDSFIFISALREEFFEILFSDNLSFYEKLDKIATKSEYFCGEELPLRNNAEIIEAYFNTEPIDEKWSAYINSIKDDFGNLTENRREFKEAFKYDQLYPRILAYIFYRHLTKAAFDGDIVSRICFCLESIRFIEFCDIKTYAEKGRLTIEDRIENLRNWSVQTEYSEENTNYLIYGD